MYYKYLHQKLYLIESLTLRAQTYPDKYPSMDVVNKIRKICLMSPNEVKTEMENL